VYGLTEFARSQVRTARLVANPGCYPTAAQVGTFLSKAEEYCVRAEEYEEKLMNNKRSHTQLSGYVCCEAHLP
jgi:N-acetyl-gamma-glutamylphosphate reductase